MNQANRTGGFRMTKVDGVRPPYKTGEIKINQRRLKKLKNKLWKMCKRKYGFEGRIKTHLDTSKDLLIYTELLVYTKFYQKWRKWKQANPKIISAITNSKNFSLLNIHSLYKLMNKTEVSA